MPVTQKDIARAVGVSQTVVSDVLQDRPRARVSAETRRRIIDTARDMGYRPNASARSLRTQRSHQVAYVITRAAAPGSYALGEQALGALAGTLAEHDYQLNLRVAPDVSSIPAHLADLYAGGQCDGYVVRVPQTRFWDWAALSALPCPALFLGHCPTEALSSLAFDMEGGVADVCAHLTTRGHQRVAFLAAEEPVDFYALAHRAWQRASASAGLAGPEAIAPERHQAAASVRGWLSGPPDAAPTAFVCSKASAALGATDALREAGRQVNGDADVVVFGQPVFGEETRAWLFPPGVWYLDHDQSAIGRRAADEMLRLLRGEPSSGPVRVRPPLCQVPTDTLPL
jgi:LacI family transcriptional regulator